MRNLIVNQFATLDGVMQSPTSPSEDAENGFAHGRGSAGGWQFQAGCRSAGARSGCEMRLMIDPVTVGGGKSLFADDGTLRLLRLVDCEPTATGAILAT